MCFTSPHPPHLMGLLLTYLTLYNPSAPKNLPIQLRVLSCLLKTKGSIFKMQVGTQDTNVSDIHAAKMSFISGSQGISKHLQSIREKCISSLQIHELIDCVSYRYIMLNIKILLITLKTEFEIHGWDGHFYYWLSSSLIFGLGYL